MPDGTVGQDARSVIEAHRAKWGKLKIDVGCGAWLRGEDFLGIDEQMGKSVKLPGSHTKEDGTVEPCFIEYPVLAKVKATMWDLPFKESEVDEIWCSHALEHVAGAKVVPTLIEFLRVLRPLGRAIITVPDFDYVAKYWLLGQNRQWAEQLVFGTQDHEGESHRCAFNAELLQNDLNGAGFEVKVLKVVWTHNQQCLQAVVVKPLKQRAAVG